MIDSMPLISTLVIEAVANEADVSPTDLDPLYNVVDPDCLDHIFHDPNFVREPETSRIEFVFEGYRVKIAGDRSVEVAPLGEQAAHSPADSVSDGEPNRS